MSVGPDDVERWFEISLAELRRRTGAKWCRYGPDVLPAWVAEMDYPVAPVIRTALAEALERGDVGYPPFQGASGVPAAFAARAEALWGWRVDPALVHLLPNVMTGVDHAIRALTEPGDGVVVTTPVYHPFLSVVPHARRRLVEVPLGPDGRLDLDGLGRAFEAGARLLLLCHPHNPTGHVLTADELDAVVDLVVEHDAWLVSDEVHAELTYPPARHVPAALAGDGRAAARTVTVTSASKAFNIAGLRCAVIVSTDPDVHARIGADADMTRHVVGTLGIVATLAAWTPAGDEWLAACRALLQRNRDHLVERLAAELPGLAELSGLSELSEPSEVIVRPPEATYLAWLDLRATGLGDDPAAWLLTHAGVALSPGPEFGAPGRGFARLNFATTPAILDQVLDRIVGALRRR